MKKKLIFLFLLFTAILSAEWTVVQTYSIPEGSSGLAFDGTYLYCGIYGANGDEVYQIDPTDGTYQLQFSDPILEDTYGMSFDGTNLWLTDHRNGTYEPAAAYQYDMSGNILSEFDLPAHYMSGIAYDNGDFWVATYYPDNPCIIYQVDNTGTVLQQFNFELPDTTEQPWDLCMLGSDLWIADYYDDVLYKVDTSGTILDFHSSEGTDPAGIVWDGQYLWYCNNGSGDYDFLYKVDLEGAGAPVIQLGWDEYDFGNTTVGQLASVELPITNSGTAELSITTMNFSLPEFYTNENLPFTIAPGASENLTILFNPSSWGTYDCTLEINSNDPVHPNEEIILTGYGMIEGPHISVTPTTQNYNSVRMGAVTGRYIEISNQGNELLELSELEFDISQYFVDDTVELPVSILPSENYNLRIWFNPEEAISYNGACIIHSNDPITPMISIALDGSGSDSSYPIGQQLWQYQITAGYDNSPKAIAPISDITNDNIDDVIVCSQDNFIRCFNGNSSGIADIIWENEISSGDVYSQNGLAIIDDIDGDDKDDIIAGTTGGDRAVHAISGKTGEDIWIYYTSEYGDGGWVYQVEASKDFNNDGVIDVLAVAGDDSMDLGPKRIFCVDGSDGTVIWSYTDGGPQFSCLSIEDVNGDNIPDAIAGASNSYESEGKVYGINGADGTQLWQFTTAGNSVWAISQVDDLNSDDIDDIVVGDFSGNYYGLNATTGNVEYSGSIGTCLIIRFETLYDVNGDSHPDILIAHNSSSNAVVIDGFTGDNIWLQSVADQPWCVDKINDITGDGIQEVLVGTLFNNNYGYFLDGADGTNLGTASISSAVDAIAGIPDINNDGSWEMVCGGRNGEVICISGGESNVYSTQHTVPDPHDIVELFGNFPNPFNPKTSINFNLEKDSNVNLEIFNIKGQLIRTLINEKLSASSYSMIWNGKNDIGKTVSSGVYLYKLQADTKQLTNKCILLK
ncbi:MAG: choice-of-anchor D domain-containing protein [Candidatus Tenebribacter davisii]|nr:choice-of-anchor D domain-containing protein [Candidatus Tenebribacter davisii]